MAHARLDNPRAPFPPGPRGHWLVGTVPRWKRGLLPYLTELTNTYGSAVRYRFLLDFHGYVFSHPEHNKHVLQDNNKNYTKQHPSLLLVKSLLGDGLFMSDGSHWLRQRRLAQPAFHKERVAAFGRIMTDAAAAMADRWRGAGERGEAVNVEQEMMRVTLTVVGRALFGLDLDGEAGGVGRAFTGVSEEFTRLVTTPFALLLVRARATGSARRLLANVRDLDRVVDRIIAQRRAMAARGEERADLLGMFMAARDEDTGERMDDRQLRDEVMTMLLAGHETTSTALTWTWALLARHPDVEARLHAELDETLGGAPPAVDDLPRLPYARMVIQEAMRLYPPVPGIGRQAVEADEVGGYYVEPKAYVTLIPYFTHRHPDFWPDAERFDPERWTPAAQAARPRYAYLPFGGGPRQCIGNTFALVEAQLILATVAQRYRLTLPPGRVVEPTVLMTLRPKGGLVMRLTNRGAGT